MKIQKVMFPGHLQKFQTKITLKCFLELNFNNFQKKKKGKITIDCYNILTVEINIIEFYVNTGFIIILYVYLLYNFLKGDYRGFLF